MNKKYRVGRFFDTYFERYVSELFDSEEECKKYMCENFTNSGKTAYSTVTVRV